MSWPYSGEPGDADLDAVRFYVQDTNSTEPLVSDEEIAFLLDSWMPVYDSVIYVASVVAEAISARFAREVSYSADGVSVGTNELQQKYADLALSLRDQYRAGSVAGSPDVGGIMVGEELDETIKPLIWAVGMNDNDRAGQQDFGGDYNPAQIPEIGGTY